MTAPTDDRLPEGRLPALVRRYLEHKVAAGDRRWRRVRFTQVGEMQLKPERRRSGCASKRDHAAFRQRTTEAICRCG